jgi:hypothetical protein
MHQAKIDAFDSTRAKNETGFYLACPDASGRHDVKRLSRHITASFLAAIYFTIALSPLASLAMHSKVIAHAVTGECSGDCAVCGCSVERSATHTCCCWLKKQEADHDHDQGAGHDCCKGTKKPATQTTLRCCPCGSGSHALVSVAISCDQLPWHYSHIEPVFVENRQLFLSGSRHATRPAEPPDPPPKVTTLS